MSKEQKLKEWIQRYEEAHFVVNKRISLIIRDSIEDGQTIEQHAILCYLHGSKLCTPTELADVFGVGKSAITAIVTRLEDKGLIERVRDDKDRRMVYLSLTAEGERVRRLAVSKIEKQIGSYLQYFSEEEIETFIHCYEMLADLMQNNGEGGEAQ
ncbi:Uncharacterized HTH-type transcriptional regulator yusO [Chlamydia abortus]|uniref:MarR family winged helix-turn-helix transcriptional regulator n=1 Tax=Paenibacillus residui TaxID=629724 RepID=A0ABW3D4B0_9BACL|nr:MarR family transcriptional regulator [Paenibacillus sp. 32O-W]SHE13962.1 Uncharacterized HTH-type transcriptional regulator yusO [Chlamydia abortus]